MLACWLTLDGIDGAPFTADRVSVAVAAESTGKFSDFPGARMLSAHGPELPDVWEQYSQLTG